MEALEGAWTRHDPGLPRPRGGPGDHRCEHPLRGRLPGARLRRAAGPHLPRADRAHGAPARRWHRTSESSARGAPLRATTGSWSWTSSCGPPAARSSLEGHRHPVCRPRGRPAARPLPAAGGTAPVCAGGPLGRYGRRIEGAWVESRCREHVARRSSRRAELRAAARVRPSPLAPEDGRELPRGGVCAHCGAPLQEGQQWCLAVRCLRARKPRRAPQPPTPGVLRARRRGPCRRCRRRGGGCAQRAQQRPAAGHGRAGPHRDTHGARHERPPHGPPLDALGKGGTAKKTGAGSASKGSANSLLFPPSSTGKPPKVPAPTATPKSTGGSTGESSTGSSGESTTTTPARSYGNQHLDDRIEIERANPARANRSCWTPTPPPPTTLTATPNPASATQRWRSTANPPPRGRRRCSRTPSPTWRRGC